MLQKHGENYNTLHSFTFLLRIQDALNYSILHVKNKIKDHSTLKSTEEEFEGIGKATFTELKRMEGIRRNVFANIFEN